MTKKLWLGALGGLLGGLAMKAIVESLDPQSFGLSSRTDANTAHAIWRKMGWPPLADERAKRIGAGMHYAFAVASGIGYATLSEKSAALRAGKGAAFGAALWLVGDELAVSASGLEDPRKTPALSHLSALGSHLVFGYIVHFMQDV